MTGSQVGTTGREKGKLEAPGIKRVIQLIIFGLVFGGVLFLSAGRLDWLEGWLFAGAFMAYMVIMSVWGVHRDPELLNERGRALSENTKGWEKVLVLFVAFLQLAMLVVAGVDAGRIGWSAMPLAGEVLGWLLMIPVAILPAWTMMSNTYAAVAARVQEERGHQVVTVGPYRYVRHPMYVGVIFMGLAVPLALGSWWALIPGLMLSVVFVLRTAQEDRLLHRELPGYAEYARRVRYRLLPGVW